MLPHVKGIGEALSILQPNKRNMLFSGYLRDLVYAHSNLHLALTNMARDSMNSSSPWFKHVPTIVENYDDLGNGHNSESNITSDESDNDDYTSFTTSCTLDSFKLYDVTSRPHEHQE